MLHTNALDHDEAGKRKTRTGARECMATLAMPRARARGKGQGRVFGHF
jgi:hypothetical protein